MGACASRHDDFQKRQQLIRDASQRDSTDQWPIHIPEDPSVPIVPMPSISTEMLPEIQSNTHQRPSAREGGGAMCLGAMGNTARRALGCCWAQRAVYGVRLQTLQRLRDRAAKLEAKPGPERAWRAGERARTRRAAGEPLTIDDVAHEVVHEDVAARGGALFDALPAEEKGLASVCVIAARDSRFDELVDAIESADGRSAARAVYWLELVMEPAVADAEWQDYGARVRQTKQRLRTVGTAMIVITPWSAPLVLADLWTLFEMKASSLHATEVHLRIPQSHKDAFTRALHAEFDGVARALVSVEPEAVVNAAIVERAGLIEAVKDEAGGLELVVQRVILLLRSWLIESAQLILRQRRDDLGLTRSLAKLLRQHGDARQTEELLRTLVQLEEERHGERHPDTLMAVQQLGVHLYDVGKLDAAAHMHRRVLELFEQQRGWDHPDTLHAALLLADVNARRNKLELAEALYVHVLAGHRPLGRKHRKVLYAQLGLGIVWDRLGRLDDAEELLRENLALREEVNGPEAPDTLRTCLQLASVLDSRGKAEEAKEYYLRASGGPIAKVGPVRSATRTLRLAAGDAESDYQSDDGEEEEDEVATRALTRARRLSQSLEARRNIPAFAQGPVRHTIKRPSSQVYSQEVPAPGTMPLV